MLISVAKYKRLIYPARTVETSLSPEYRSVWFRRSREIAIMFAMLMIFTVTAQLIQLLRKNK